MAIHQGQGQKSFHSSFLLGKSQLAPLGGLLGECFLGGAIPKPGQVQSFQVERFIFISSPRSDQALGNQPGKLLIDKPDQQFINFCWQL